MIDVSNTDGDARGACNPRSVVFCAARNLDPLYVELSTVVSRLGEIPPRREDRSRRDTETVGETSETRSLASCLAVSTQVSGGQWERFSQP